MKLIVLSNGLFLGRDMLNVHDLFLDLLGVDASTVETNLSELQGSSLIVGQVDRESRIFVMLLETVYTQISFI